MREKRLKQDFQILCDLQRKSNLIDIEPVGDHMNRYKITYNCKSLVWIEDNSDPSYSSRHEMEIYLHKDYPRRPPQLKWLTNVFHPNILPPHKNGGVCIGWWTAAETIDSLCVRIGEMLQYKNYNLADPLDEEAAEWVKNNLDILPVDERDLCLNE